jgi:type VI protein secretion system component VasK
VFLTWPLRQRWFWMLFFLLLLVLIVPFLVIGLLVNFSPSTLFVILVVLVVVWLVNRSYRGWKRKQDEQREEAESMPPQRDLEAENVSTSEPAKITCPYCGNAYDAKDDACPYCGRKKPSQEQP